MKTKPQKHTNLECGCLVGSPSSGHGLWRRFELWTSFGCCLTIGGTFAWLAMTRGHSFLWWFAGPFLILLPITSWKATRPERVFVEEQEKLHAFNQRHPILAAMLALGTVAGASCTLWKLIGSIVTSLGR